MTNKLNHDRRAKIHPDGTVNHHADLIATLTQLAREFDRRDDALPADEKPLGAPDGHVLREAAQRLRARPCVHSPEPDEFLPDVAWCRWCGIEMRSVWRPTE